MKKVLILGGTNFHIKLATAAKELGYYTIVTDYLTDSPAKKIADEGWMLSIVDVDGIVQRCRTEHVDAVINAFHDPCQRPYFEICHKLGLPCYIDTWEQAVAMTDKSAFKKACARFGVDTINTYDECEFDRMEYPVIVKPSICRGSKGQIICNSREEFDAACNNVKQAFGDSTMVVEKFFGNHDEFSVQYLVLSGTPYLLWSTDRHPGKPGSGLERVSRGNSMPSYFTEKYMECIHGKVSALFKGLKIQNGPIMLQGFIDGNTVRFFDMGFRFGGIDFASVYKKYFETDLFKAMIEFSITGSMDNRFVKTFEGMERLKGFAGIALFPVIREGTICSIEGLEEVMNIRGVHGYALRHMPGEEVKATGDNGQRLAEVDIFADSLQDVKRAVGEVLRTLRPLDADGKNMLYGNIDPEEIKGLKE